MSLTESLNIKLKGKALRAGTVGYVDRVDADGSVLLSFEYSDEPKWVAPKFVGTLKCIESPVTFGRDRPCARK